jgi:alpha-tubulin suppressor-like RCC1 family protein
VSGGISFRSISAALWGACGLAVNGSAYCWGFNVWYQLGNETLTGATAPTAVAGGLAFEEMVLGAVQGCGLVNQEAYCWGGRTLNWGQLGNGSFMASSTPVAVQGGLSFSAVVPSYANNIYAFTCGLTVDGAAYCWGASRLGQLGTDVAVDICESGGNDFPCSSVPVPVAGGIDFISLATGNEFACGVARNGAAFCWGRNEFGQLGDGTTANSNVPVQVVGLP